MRDGGDDPAPDDGDDPASDRGEAAAGTSGDRAGRDPAAVAADLDRPVVLFDGVCDLCNRFVRFVVRFDAAGTFRFAPLQSPVGRAVLARHGFDTDAFDGDDLDAMVLVEPDGTTATKSTAALRVLRRLDGPWPLLWPLVYLPERLRDAVYDIVAANRYRVFGRREACPVPGPEVRERFAERSLE